MAGIKIHPNPMTEMQNIIDSQYKEIDDLRKESERLWNALENIHWLVQGEMTDEALTNLRAYVGRKVVETGTGK